MEENKVLISLERYNELLTAEACKNVLEEVLFDSASVRLSYDRKYLCFEPNEKFMKIIFPVTYKRTIERLSGDSDV